MSSTVGRGRRPIVFVALLVIAAFAVAMFAQQSPRSGPDLAAPGGPNGTPNAADAAAGPVAVGNGVSQGKSYKHDKTAKPLKDMPAIANKPRDREEEEEEEHGEPRRPTEPRNVADGGMKNKSAETAALTTPEMPTANANFDGVPFPGVGCNCAPPDTNGEVGLTQYVQSVNEALQVFNKSTGASVLGPISIATIWNGFGGVCQNNGSGDPVVLYDQLANRWLVSQFAGSSVPTDECVAVSTSSDATGTWFRYGFHLGTNFFDYPHLSVWPDAYYMSMNVFNSSGTAFLGPQPFAFDRAAMLAGNAATFVTTGLLSSNDDPLLPADLDGLNLPPAGSPAPFIMSGTMTTQRIYRMHPNFSTPASTTFTLAGTLNPPAFGLACTTTRACVQQPSPGERLDAIGDRPMFRAAYRRFADGHEALVGNETVCVANGGNCESPGTAIVAVRWWEIKNLTSGTPTIVQAATYQPDATHRWMGSAAMDLQGNLAVCYSASSTTVVPGLRCTGRLAADPLNTMTQGESTMFAGAGTQTGTSSRWGDYSDLTIDPVDDCTFWFTSEYYPAGNTSFNWRTRVVSFKFPGCVAGPHGTAHFTVTQCGGSTPVAGATVTIDGNNYGLTNASGVLDATLVPGSHAWNVTKAGWTTGSGNVSITEGVTSNLDQCLSSGTAHFVVTNCTTSAPLAGATITVDGNVAGQTNASGVLDVPLPPGPHGWIATRVNYTQTSGSVNVVNATQTPVPACLTPTCFETTTFSQWFDGVTAPALPTGWTTQVVQGPAPAWVTSSTAGTLAPAADSAPNSAFIDDPSVVSDKVLVSPAIGVTSQAAQLSFRQRGVFEAGWDGGVLEIKIGGGAFIDIITAGGAFGVGGYTSTLLSGNPMAGRAAWSGTIGTTSSFSTVTVTLPSAAAGQNIQFRWREGSDVSVAGSGWRIDGVTLNDCVANPPTTPPPPTASPTASPTQQPTPSPTQQPTPTGTQLPTPTPTSSAPTARLTSSGTTCAQFSGGSSTELTGVTYGVRAGKVNSASPTTFRYWVKVNAVAGSNSVIVTQAIGTPSTFRTLFKLSSGGNVYNAACGTGFTPTFTSSAINNVTSGSVTVSFTAPSAGTYFVSVNYTWSSLKNKAVPAPTSVPYTFSVATVTDSAKPLSLHQ